ncbi:MAG: NADH-quinone oxidoreductase subunit L, partial [Opitutaceae bacterium]|nr:NADH-quinone oxidoreductase subunit L [Opitutaceae bacterium]
MTPTQQALCILLLPLASAAIIALFLRRQGAIATAVSVTAAAALAGLSLGLIFGGERFTASMEWLRLGSLSISL